VPVENADDLMGLVMGGDYGRVERLIPTTPPVYEFWTGFSGNGSPQNFAHTPGHAYMFLPIQDIGPERAAVSGKVYNDNDGDQVFEPGDGDILLEGQFILMRSPPAPPHLYGQGRWTKPDGTYSAFVRPGTYTVRVVPQGGQSFLPATHEVTLAPGAVVTDLDFGRYPVPADDLSVLIYNQYPDPLASPCPDQQMDYCVRYQNVGSLDQASAVVTLKLPSSSLAPYDSTTVSDNCTAPPLDPSVAPVGGTLLVWDIDPSFAPGDACTVCATVTVDASVEHHTLLSASSSVYLSYVDPDSNVQDSYWGSPNNAGIAPPVRCAHDPNDKQATPAGCGAFGVINPEPLEYLVRFQNEGSAPATNVIIHDTLDANLDEATFEVIDTSHPLTELQLTGDRELIWSFLGINLPDSTTNEPASHGFVRFRIEPKAGVTEGTIITNTAAIVFDLEDPVVTEPAVTTITYHALPANDIPVTEICNGIDDDCNGVVDDQLGTTSCGVGACAHTVSDCASGLPQACDPFAGATAEICDGVDNDCDGVVDIQAAGPVLAMGLSSADSVDWSTPPTSFGVFDLVSGSLNTLLSTGGDFGVATDLCVANDTWATSMIDTPALAPGEAVWYLVRNEECGGQGQYESAGYGQAAERSPDINAGAGCP